MLPISTCVVSADKDNSASDKISLYGTSASGRSSCCIKVVSMTSVTSLLCRQGGVIWSLKTIVLVSMFKEKGVN